MSAPLNIAVAQIGARRHYAIPNLLESAGLLQGFYTDLCADVFPWNAIAAAYPARIQPAGLKRLLGRRVGGVPRAKIHCASGFALSRVFARSRTRTPDGLHRHFANANHRFATWVTQQDLTGASAVYTFNGAGLELLQWAKERGLKTFVEQTDAPVRVESDLVARERADWPGWEDIRDESAGTHLLAQRERAEWELADTILAGSDYVRLGIADEGGPAERVRVVPYGFPDGTFKSRVRGRGARALRVLFVGTLCLRKGLPYLMEAARLLRASGEAGRSVEFRAVGPSRLSDTASHQLRAAVELAGPVPRSTIAREYEWADVLVLPSISEGSANVCYEALACGVPVVTTPNSGSVVRDGVDGFVVPIRSAADIAERLRQLAGDDDLLAHLSHNAAGRADEFTWDRYSERLLSAVRGDASPLPGIDRFSEPRDDVHAIREFGTVTARHE